MFTNSAVVLLGKPEIEVTVPGSSVPLMTRPLARKNM
jgi:hypothetical protein